MRETLARVAWLEACGWTGGDDGLWRHSWKAAGAPLRLSHAFDVEQRSRTGDRSPRSRQGPSSFYEEPQQDTHD